MMFMLMAEEEKETKEIKEETPVETKDVPAGAPEDDEAREAAARARRRKRRRRQQTVYTLIAVVVLCALIAGIGFGALTMYRRYFAEDRPLRADPETIASTQETTSDAGGSDASSEKTPEQLLSERVEATIAQMPLEDKVAALFVVTPEQLTGNTALLSADQTLQDALNRYPVAGIVFSEANLEDAKQISDLMSGTQRMSRYPLFLGVSETGGGASAVADALGRERPASPQDTAALANAATARAAGTEIAAYLKEAGFNLNLAPHASLSSDNTNDTLYGSDAAVTASLSAAFLSGEREAGIFTAVDAFPLPGEQDAGGRDGETTTSRTMSDLQAAEFEPFRACMEAGAEIVILSNISASRAIGTSVNIPCSISEAMVTGQIRGTLAYEGIIMTAPFDQDVITGGYTSDHIAVAAVVAGCDLIYRPQDLSLAHAGIMEAVENGVITEERINQSLRRIFRIKLRE